MTPSADAGFTSERNIKLRITDGTTRSHEGYGDINFVFRSGNGLVNALLTNVAYVPDLRYHLFSLPILTKNGHAFKGCPTGVIVRLKSDYPVHPLRLQGRQQQ